MAPMRTLVSLAMRKTLLKTAGETFQLKYSGLAPDRMLVVMRPTGAYTLQFYSACDPRPTQLFLSSFEAVLHTVVCVSRWRLESLEFYNIPFNSIYTGLLETTIETAGIQTVLLRNCTFPGISTSNEAIELLNSLNRSNKGMFFECGDDSLISRIRLEGHAERAEHAQLDQHDENPDAHCSGVPVRSLVALSIETVLLKTSDHRFLQGIDRIKDLGLAPKRICITMTRTGRHVLQFHTSATARPFTANFSTFGTLLAYLVHIHTWKVRAIEFFGVRFHAQDTQMLHNSLEQLGVERVLLNNCLYPGITNRDEGRKLVTALKRTIDVKVGQTGSTKIWRLLQL